jgi:hypothetical protein
MRLRSEILLSLGLFCAGCFTERSITRDEAVPVDTKVYFHLADSSCVRSYAGRHERIDGGYTVSGDLFVPGTFPKKFDGVISDSAIVRVTQAKLNWWGTILGVALVVPILVGILAMAGTNWGLR